MIVPGLSAELSVWQIEGVETPPRSRRLRAKQEQTVPLLNPFKAWLDNTVHSVPPKDSLGEAVHYVLRHWRALTNFAEAGHLDASNNFAERFMVDVSDLHPRQRAQQSRGTTHAG